MQRWSCLLLKSCSLLLPALSQFCECAAYTK
jgi:hypothetical protein